MSFSTAVCGDEGGEQQVLEHAVLHMATHISRGHVEGPKQLNAKVKIACSSVCQEYEESRRAWTVLVGKGPHQTR